MRRLFLSFISFCITNLFLAHPLSAAGVGSSGGQALLEMSGSRPSSLGEAFSAVPDDINGFGFNPALLGSLTKGHASVLYTRNQEDISRGHFSIGMPSKKAGLGLQFSYIDSGSFELFDGNSEQTVRARTDMMLGLGYAKNLGRANIGFIGKYLSSVLLETTKAHAFALDAGVTLNVGSNLNLGAALQNIGTALKFDHEADRLPRIARIGLSRPLMVNAHRVLLVADSAYLLNERDFQPGIGLELTVGPLALRGGLKREFGLNRISAGTGFELNSFSLDYSFGLTQQQSELEHRVNLSTRFGSQRETSKLEAHLEHTNYLSSAKLPTDSQSGGLRNSSAIAHTN